MKRLCRFLFSLLQAAKFLADDIVQSGRLCGHRKKASNQNWQECVLLVDRPSTSCVESVSDQHRAAHLPAVLANSAVTPKPESQDGWQVLRRAQCRRVVDRGLDLVSEWKRIKIPEQWQHQSAMMVSETGNWAVAPTGSWAVAEYI
jgi:hypothetical protein